MSEPPTPHPQDSASSSPTHSPQRARRSLTITAGGPAHDAVTSPGASYVSMGSFLPSPTHTASTAGSLDSPSMLGSADGDSQPSTPESYPDSGTPPRRHSHTTHASLGVFAPSMIGLSSGGHGHHGAPATQGKPPRVPRAQTPQSAPPSCNGDTERLRGLLPRPASQQSSPSPSSEEAPSANNGHSTQPSSSTPGSPTQYSDGENGATLLRLHQHVQSPPVRKPKRNKHQPFRQAIDVLESLSQLVVGTLAL